MTKSEFRTEASKAKIHTELFGVVIAGSLHTTSGFNISGGKIVGIEWYDTWHTREDYSCMRGTYTEKFLAKTPFVVISKNRHKYLVEASRVRDYVEDLKSKWFLERLKTKEPL